jgi:hypothetical protein
MAEPPEPAKCNSNGCNRPVAGNRASCEKHLQDARDRAARRRLAQKAAPCKAREPTAAAMKVIPPTDDASETRLPLQPSTLNRGTEKPAKRKRPEDDDSSDEEDSVVHVKVSDDLSWWVPPAAHIQFKRPQPERIYDNKEELLKDLCQSYKNSKGIITFDGAYDIPEGDVDNWSIEKRNSMDKSTLEALADSIWDGTKRRWRYEKLYIFCAFLYIFPGFLSDF